MSEMPTLASMDARLCPLIPAQLYQEIHRDPTPEQLMRVFRHLQTLHRILVDYVPRDVSRQPPIRGVCRHSWDQGTLLFTDLAGFTPLMEAYVSDSGDGAEALLSLLNRYFAVMVEIVSKSGGNLIEFTGDALLVQFSSPDATRHAQRAVRAGLRMQRAMEDFTTIATDQGPLSLKMRVGLHGGAFLKADIGTAHRMGHVLLGHTVQRAKQAEAAGQVGQVALTDQVRHWLGPAGTTQPHGDHHWLVAPGEGDADVGEFDISLSRHRLSTPVLVDSSFAGLCEAIHGALPLIDPLASYLPSAVLRLLVESAARRKIPPTFPTVAVAFVNLIGFQEALADADNDEVESLVTCFSQAFAMIDGLVEAQGGILQKATYHAIGSELLIHFGALSPAPTDADRAAATMLAIRDRIPTCAAPVVQGRRRPLTCRIGMTYGPVFSAEIGEPRGRREFNVLGNPVNTAARLMERAAGQQILLNQAMAHQLGEAYHSQPLGMMALKGKRQPEPVYALAPQDTPAPSPT